MVINLVDLRQKFVKYIYADHNSSSIVKGKLKTLLSILDEPGTKGLNIGAGHTRVHPRILNLDIFPGKNIDIVGLAENIPCEDRSFDIIISQECLEHVRDPFKAMNEIYRILKVRGKIYLQLPFIIGYHPGPSDYWRFTVEGIEEMVSRCNLKLIEKGIVVGNGSGFYRIAVEFFACLFSLPSIKLYKPFKGLFALLFYPLKATDFLFKFSHQKNRIPGGFYVIAEK